ncbi:MAG: calycin-like domain-containing protein, partial [Prevotella sp.]
MKKIFTFIAAVMCAINSQAKDYKDSLVINVAGVVTEQSAIVALTQSADGRYTFTLKNLLLNIGGESTGVGTVIVDNLESFNASGNTMLQ